ncbi:branched-chain amino acid ABC transporter permease [Aliidongia dinghuensis]|uniref:Branched-chain amino acid ABC transporter permease n=1 Tax=Aliidongia dinghuensis TaxID=1867774 RepID=A0A8J3E604_9PROT|nr:branched-chain amino acid ABC transporter permease [Aliidongia dinghuensis]GGF25638.1 branched-chain amino acid ABC transporter permease [Aliidongia dinghuensis]
MAADLLGLAQLLLNGLALGAAYALVALGFVLILNATGAVNFAQGDLVMLGGYVAIALSRWLDLAGIDLSGPALLPLVMLAMAGCGLLFSALAWRPFRSRPPIFGLLATVALGLVLQEAMNALEGAAPRAGPTLVGTGDLRIGPFGLSRSALGIMAAALVIGLAQAWLLGHTQFGRRLRASAQDPVTARALGLPVDRLIAGSFALAAALAGAVGLLLSGPYFVTPSMGNDLILRAYIAVTIGGWGSLKGAVAGALLIALFESVVAGYTSSVAATAALYGVVLLVLAVRPAGLFPEPLGRRA